MLLLPLHQLQPLLRRAQALGQLRRPPVEPRRLARSLGRVPAAAAADTAAVAVVQLLVQAVAPHRRRRRAHPLLMLAAMPPFRLLATPRACS